MTLESRRHVLSRGGTGVSGSLVSMITDRIRRALITISLCTRRGLWCATEADLEATKVLGW